MRRWSVMDGDASDAERQQAEKIEANNQRIQDDWEREIAAAKGESEPNVFDGADVQADLSYTDAEHLRNTKLAEQVREVFPDFDDVIINWAVPAVERNKRLWRTVLDSKNPAFEGYRFGLLMRHEQQAQRRQGNYPARTLTRDEINQMTPEQLEEHLAEMRNGAPQEEPSAEEFISADDKRLMNVQPPDKFAAGLDWLKRHRG